MKPNIRPLTGHVLKQALPTSLRTLVVLFAMMLTTLGAWADSTFSGGSGTSTAPYQISSTDDLNQLATDVNNGNGYSGKYFVLTADITYDYSNLSSTQSNYTPIGGYSNVFRGDFDGNGHTISGIRVYHAGNGNTDGYLGLFGATTNAKIHDLVLSDTHITGHDNTGGIVGYQTSGYITNCHVTSTVCVQAVQTGAQNHGGITGGTNPTSNSYIQNCSSAATLTAPATNSCIRFGGIVGFFSGGTFTDNLVIGAIIPAISKEYGAISGTKYSSSERNYYSACTVAGTANATGVGANAADNTTNDGAVPGYFINLGDNVSSSASTFTIPAHGSVAAVTYHVATSGTSVTLSYTGTPPTGYHLGGYTVKDADNGDVAVSDGAFTMPAKNVTATAAFTGNSYTVSFVANGGEGTMSDQAFTYGTAQQLTANGFSRTGYTFAGWNTVADGSGTSYAGGQSVQNLTTEDNGNITLYAQWTIINYTISYPNATNGTNGVTNSNPTTYNVNSAAITLSAPSRAGFTFGGWYSDEQCTQVANTTIAQGSTGDKTFYAKWTVHTYTVAFDANGGTGTMSDQAFTYGETKALPTCTFTAPAGKVFARWNTEVDGSGTSYAGGQSVQNLTTENNGNITLYAQWVDEKYAEPLTLEFPNGGTITVTSPKSGMQYAVNGGSKTAVTSAGITVTAGQKVQFYGNGTSITSYDDTQIGCSADCYVYGNIMSLVDETGFVGNTTLTAEHTFQGLFSGNTYLKNHATKELVLPATKLSECCYEEMFSGCTGLTTAPALPATELAAECYTSMFEGCTNLQTAPELKATKLEDYCYYGMFLGCTGLTTAPALPATELAAECYENMFDGCTSLRTAPELPATTLTAGCYAAMFNDCSSLTTAPALPATQLAISCYSEMFYGCTSLTTAPELPATTLANNCYYLMFTGCTSLQTAPALPATTLVDNCYYYMFSDCTGLNYIEMLATDISAKNSLSEWVYGVASTGVFVKNSAMTALSSGPSGIPSGWTVVNANPSLTQRYGAVNVYDDGSTKTAVIDGASTEEVSITSGIAADRVLMTRQFTASKPATVMLPFSIETTNLSGAAVYTFGGVSYKDNKWIATMNAVSGTLAANTPYLVMPSATSIAFTGGATLNTTGGGGQQTADQGSHWTFKGTYNYMKWTTDTSDPDYSAERAAEIGKVYGFAGVAKDDISVGDFVKVASGAKIRPMGCYLLWSDTQNSARAMNRGAATAEELPNRITVRLVGSNGETTAIGTLDTQTGEMTFDSEAWYTLNGTRLSGKPTKKGLYINNGRKVVVH